MRRQRSTPLLRELLLIMLLGQLPLAVLGAWIVARTFEEQKQEIRQTTLDISRAMASAVDAELNGTIKNLSTLSRSHLLVTGDLRGFHGQSRAETVAQSGWLSVVLSDPSGKVVLRSTEPFDQPTPTPIETASLKEAISTGAPTVGRVATGRGGRSAFPVRVPIMQEGKLVYVLSAAVSPVRIGDLLARQQVPKGWRIAVFDGHGTRVARSIDPSNSAGTRGSKELDQLLGRPDPSGSTIATSPEGIEFLVSFTRVSLGNWSVVVGAPTAHLYTAVFRRISWYLLGLLAAGMVCWALAWRSARRVSADIEEVRDKAVQLGEGAPIQLSGSRIREVDHLRNALSAASRRLTETNRSLQDALRQADDAARAKDDFMAVLGHELRNPLAPMLTALHLMDLKPDGSPTRQERDVLKRQVEHMRRLVDDLLDISRIASGKLELRLGAVDMAIVVDRAIEAVQPLAAQRGVRIEVELPALPIWVTGDETRLVQVVTNLLTNALRFGEDAPVQVAVGSDPAREHVVLTVTDHGVGMAPETREHVFQPFYQVAQPLSRSRGGLGLGLAIVRSIVDLHGGSVQAFSEGLGKGSRFELRLPIGERATPAPQEGSERTSHAGRVLVVDDNVDAAETLAEMLRIAGYEVQLRFGSQGVLEAIRLFDPQVLICDIGLPEQDGYAVARAVRSEVPEWRGTMVALSGYGQQVDKARSAEAGFALHLTKPCEPTTLLTAIAECAARVEH